MQELIKLLNDHTIFWDSTKLVLTASVTAIVVILLLRLEKKLAKKLLG